MKISSMLQAEQILGCLLLAPIATAAGAHLQLAAVWGHYDFRASSTVLAACDALNEISAVSTDGSIRTWKVDGTELRLHRGSRQLASAAFSADCGKILSANPEGELELADAETGRELRSFEKNIRGTSCLALSPEGSIALACDGTGRVQLWNLQTGSRTGTLVAGRGAIVSADFSADGRRVATVSRGGSILVWDLKSGPKVINFPRSGGEATAIAFSPDGASIVTGAADGTIHIWDLQSRREIQTFAGHKMAVGFVRISPDSRYVISAAGVEVKRWDRATGLEARGSAGHTGSVNAIAVSPDGKLAASAGDDRTVRIWNAIPSRDREGAVSNLKSTLRGDTVAVSSVAFSADGRLLLSGGRDELVRLWNVARASSLQAFAGHKDVVSAVAFDANLPLSASWDRSVLRWDSPRGTVVLAGETRILSMSAANGFILTGDASGVLTLCKADGTKLRSWPGHTGEVYSVAISPDGKLGLSAGRDSTVKLWDLATGKQLRTFLGHTSYVAAAAFSFDAKRIVSAGGDQTVRVWDTATGIELGSADLQSSMDLVRSVAVARDGSVLVGTNRGVILRFKLTE